MEPCAEVSASTLIAPLTGSKPSKPIADASRTIGEMAFCATESVTLAASPTAARFGPANGSNSASFQTKSLVKPEARLACSARSRASAAAPSVSAAAILAFSSLARGIAASSSPFAIHPLTPIQTTPATKSNETAEIDQMRTRRPRLLPRLPRRAARALRREGCSITSLFKQTCAGGQPGVLRSPPAKAAPSLCTSTQPHATFRPRDSCDHR